MKRSYCKCPYCPFISIKYQYVKMHVQYKHPDEEVMVGEVYSQVEDEKA